MLFYKNIQIFKKFFESYRILLKMCFTMGSKQILLFHFIYIKNKEKNPI